MQHAREELRCVQLGQTADAVEQQLPDSVLRTGQKTEMQLLTLRPRRDCPGEIEACRPGDAGLCKLNFSFTEREELSAVRQLKECLDTDSLERPGEGRLCADSG